LVRVALERQSIEKKDFPIGRRGYDPEAVDAHLRAVADEVEELGRASRRRTETLASTASDHVRAIVEAAESSAAEIQRQSEAEAREIRAEASSEARAMREDSNLRAREYVARVSDATSAMLERLDTMGSELTALLESLRTGSNRLDADLQLLARNLEEVRESASPQRRFETEPQEDAVAPTPALGVVAAERERAAEIEEPVEAEAEVAEMPPAGAPLAEVPLAEVPPAEVPLAAMPQAGPEGAAAPAPSGPADGSDDTEGARLIALNMALNGTPREETDRYLAENFELVDRDRLLDEVYASLGG
jgi:DivIVA domain-containing protein